MTLIAVDEAKKQVNQSTNPRFDIGFANSGFSGHSFEAKKNQNEGLVLTLHFCQTLLNVKLIIIVVVAAVVFVVVVVCVARDVAEKIIKKSLKSNPIFNN